MAGPPSPTIYCYGVESVGGPSLENQPTADIEALMDFNVTFHSMLDRDMASGYSWRDCLIATDSDIALEKAWAAERASVKKRAALPQASDTFMDPENSCLACLNVNERKRCVRRWAEPVGAWPTFEHVEGHGLFAYVDQGPRDHRVSTTPQCRPRFARSSVGCA
eukprot:15436568-Alexandrium_andersonii.AAC.2